jgi:hypothetical protein
MTPKEAIQAVYHGRLVECTADEYPEIRRALQDQAGKQIDGGDHLRAQIALMEVQRLDTVHDFQLFPGDPGDVTGDEEDYGGMPKS